MLRSAPRLLAVLLCGAALCGCATISGKDIPPSPQEKSASAEKKNLPTDIEGGVAQARTMRVAGQYDDAVHILSQLMLVASDDPRVVAEYGKTLASQGRAQEASDFLNRAVELSPNDWTLYSATGVADDQLGNQVAARTAYEHALALKPNEPSVLNNYALSRMMANDADGARILIARAQAAGGASDTKIAANIAMIGKLAPAQADAVAAIPKAPVSSKVSVVQPPQPAPAKPVAMAALPAPAKPMQNAPRSLVPPPAPVRAASVQAAPNGVVMQAVPFDPLAGPVKPASHKPLAAAKADAPQGDKTADSKPVAIKPTAAKPVDAKPAPVRAADARPAVKAEKIKDQIPALRLTADARNP